MANLSSDTFSAEPILFVVWGHQEINQAVFDRWNQGFVFSADEPSALVQFEGGPCSVIAPIQAHIFKNMYKEFADSWQKVTVRDADELLAVSLAEILCRCAGDGGPARLVVPDSPASAASDVTEGTEDAQDRTEAGPEPATESNTESEPAAAAGAGAEPASGQPPKRRRIAPAGFHAALRLLEIQAEADVADFFRKNLASYRAGSGVLAFLYSLIQTKGIERLQSEMADSEEALVDAVHGHGSQSLTNLLLTGRAVAHVWDNVKYVGGIALEGVVSQPDVGFLTLLERLHYCTVGWNLKNPLHPVWVLASETHLTVLFSPDSRLTAPPSPRQMAQRTFDALDREQSGFLPTSQLAELMAACDLVSEAEYVDLMRRQLDPDQLGIVLRIPFLDEFFPETAAERPPDAFTVYHYNGLVRSHPDGRVKLVKGDACLLETDVQSSPAVNTILTCLQSRWPRIDVRWHGATPSIN